MPKCKNCKLRKYYAKVFDVHFDYRDCPFRGEERI